SRVASSRVGAVRTSRPSTDAPPLVGCMRRPTIDSSVDLPAPLGPMSAVMPPASMRPETGPSTRWPPYSLVTSWNSITGTVRSQGSPGGEEEDEEDDAADRLDDDGEHAVRVEHVLHHRLRQRERQQPEAE